jgi:hypothetical protein
MAQHTSLCGTTHLRQQGSHVFQQPKSDYKAPQFLSRQQELQTAHREACLPEMSFLAFRADGKKIIPVSGRSKCTGILLFPLLSSVTFSTFHAALFKFKQKKARKKFFFIFFFF